MSVNAIVGLSLVFGLINNIAITAFFGLNRSVDAYFASFMLINLFMFLVVDFLGKNFLPIFAVRRAVSRSSASELASLVVTQFGILAVIVVIVLVVFSKPIFALLLPGFAADDISLVVTTFMVMAPSIVLKTISAFHEYVWQHNEQYNRVVVARIFVPVTLTVFILVFHKQLGTGALPWGFLWGQVICAGILMYRIPYRYQFRIGLRDQDFLKIVRNSGVLMGTGLVARSKSVIVQYFGSQLGEGAISAVAIATKICQPVYQSALLGMRMILFSRSAKAVARDDKAAFARMHNRALIGVFFLTVPVAAWYAIEGELIVRALFQRGAFTDNMVSLVYAALLGMAGSVVFSGALQMGSNAFYALDRVQVPATVMPLGTILYLILAAALVPQFGIVGLTGATSLVSLLVLAILLWKLREHVASLDIASISIGLAKYFAASVVAVTASRFVTSRLEIGVILEFVLSALVAGTVYLAVVWLSGDRFIREIVARSGISEWIQRQSAR